MALSRPILLALAGALVAVVAFYATMGARSPSDSSKEPAAAPAKRDAATPKSATRDGSARKADGARRRASPAAAKPEADGRAAGRPAGAATRGLPADVDAALGRGRTVVLFFFQRGSADDDATARAVASVRGAKNVRVFTAPISRLAEYKTLTSVAGVSQAPSVVILRQGRSARLVEGFVDPETLRQQVADAG